MNPFRPQFVVKPFLTHMRTWWTSRRGCSHTSTDPNKGPFWPFSRISVAMQIPSNVPRNEQPASHTDPPEGCRRTPRTSSQLKRFQHRGPIRLPTWSLRLWICSNQNRTVVPRCVSSHEWIYISIRLGHIFLTKSVENHPFSVSSTWIYIITTANGWNTSAGAVRSFGFRMNFWVFWTKFQLHLFKADNPSYSEIQLLFIWDPTCVQRHLLNRSRDLFTL